jgi:hypothetical protein
LLRIDNNSNPFEFGGDGEFLPCYGSMTIQPRPSARTESVVDEVRKTMSTLDDIAGERQRLSERLARVDAERTKLADQLAELDAAERVLSRLTPARAATARRGRRSETAQAAKPASAPARRRGAGGRGRKAVAKAAVPLGEATLRAVEALGNEVSAEQVREYLGKQLGMQVRPNHLGMALQRHRRGGRLSEREGHWSMPQG